MSILDGYNTALAANKTAAAAAAAKPTQAQLDQEIAPETQTVISDLNSGNYAGAWSSALSTSPLFGTNYNSGTTDPLLQAMESGSGLQQLDPSKTWDDASTNAFYAALGNNPVYNGKTVAGVNGQAESLGKNPYGLWGAGATVTNGHDASVNESTAGDNSAPDVERFAGARPSQSFLSKYGADIAGLVATVATAGAGGGALAAALAGSAASDVVNGAEGKLTATGAIEGLATAAAGAAVPGLGSALGGATGIGTTAGTALAGAAVGAGTSALTGKNPLIGALTGGVSGAIQGSGITKTAGNAVGSALGGGTLANAAGAGLVGGALGAATGGGIAALTGNNVGNSALTGGVSGAVTGAVGSATGNNALGKIAGGLGTMAISPLLSSGSSATSNGSGSSATSNGGGSAVQGSAGPYDFSSTSSTLGSLLGPALQSASGVYGSQNAAEDQQKWDSTAIGTQTASLANNTGLYNTALGDESTALANANTAYGNAAAAQSTLLGNANNIYAAQIGAGNNADAEIQALEGGTSTPANYSNFINSPGYQFAISQGTQAIQRAAAANGGAYTPNTLTNVGQYVTGTASQNYNNYMAQLQNTAGLGAQGNAGLASANTAVAGNLASIYGQQAGTNATISGQQATTLNNQAANATDINDNISQLQANEGVAQAQGVLGSSGAVGSSIGAIGNGISSLLGLGGSNGIGSVNGSGFNSNTNVGGTGMNQAQYNSANAPTSSEISAQTAGATTGDNSLGNLFDPSTVNNPGFNQLNIANDVEDTPSDINTSNWLNLEDDI